MSDKTQRERVKDAAAYLADELSDLVSENEIHWEALARGVFTAANAPLPTWPTRESVERFKAAYRSSTNTNLPMSDKLAISVLREAMVVDPIIKAAVRVRDVKDGHAVIGGGVPAAVEFLADAVTDAER